MCETVDEGLKKLYGRATLRNFYIRGFKLDATALGAAATVTKFKEETTLTEEEICEKILMGAFHHICAISHRLELAQTKSHFKVMLDALENLGFPPGQKCKETT